MLAKRLASMGIRQMHFDERELHAQQRIAQGDAGVGEGARVEDGERGAVLPGLVDPGDELVLRIALEGLELVTRLLGHGRRPLPRWTPSVAAP